jgi:hypothetical protein
MDSYLPADFFLLDDTRRRDELDPALGADAPVHFEAPVFTSGLRDWRRHSREGGNPGALHHDASSPAPRRRGDDDAEWRPL